MRDEPSVLSVDAQRAAIIRLTIPRAELPKVMGPAIGELTAALRAQGIPPCGPLFAHHLRMDGDMFDVEVGFPVAGAVAAVGRVRPGELPAGRVVRATHQGDYAGLSTTWVAVRRWMDDHQHRRGEDLWEVYVTGPGNSDDPAQWRTELNQPIVA